MAAKKKLYRSKEDKVITGLFGGLGDYFDIDATILRLIWVFIVIFTAVVPGFIAYIIAPLIVPKKPSKKLSHK